MNRKPIFVLFLIALILLTSVACGGAAATEVASNDAASTSSEANNPQLATDSISCLVPDVVGLDQAIAQESLANLGLQPVKSIETNDVVAKDAVISMNPDPGTELDPCQGKVTIVISQGPPATSTNTPPPPTNTPMPTETPTQTPTPEPTATSTPFPSGPVEFSAPNDVNSLNPAFGWQPGVSGASSYDVSANSGSLTLIAGPDTDQWGRKDTAPLISYPYKGNFEARVRLLFTPQGPRHKLAGLGVRAINDHRNWIRITKEWDRQIINIINGYEARPGEASYSNDVVHLKIERRGSLFTFSYSDNGSNWSVLQKDYVVEMPDDVEIYLTVFSTSHEGAVAEFSDFTVIAK